MKVEFFDTFSDITAVITISLEDWLYEPSFVDVLNSRINGRLSTSETVISKDFEIAPASLSVAVTITL